MRIWIIGLVIFSVLAMCFQCFGLGYTIDKNIPKRLTYMNIVVLIFNFVMFILNINKI